MKTRLAEKNLLFVELIIVILFFSITAAACVTLFGNAHENGNHSRDLTNAVVMAQNSAEIFKATGEIVQYESDGLRLEYTIIEKDGYTEYVIDVFRILQKDEHETPIFSLKGAIL
jgi:hypothetical protein